MRQIYRCCLVTLAIGISAFNVARAQQAVVRKDASLRAGPSADEKPEEKVRLGDALTLIDPTPERGYYQVRTAAGKEGWVFARSLRIVASPSSSEPVGDSESPNVVGQNCDDTLWNHVYHPHRLVVKQPCIAVTGTIVDATAGREADGVKHEPDGDTHGWLRVDPGFEDLLNGGNLSSQGGNLVFEVVCKFPVTQPDAASACANYAASVSIPPVGSHAQIVGSYVRDTYHAQWMEMHPVTSITVVH